MTVHNHSTAYGEVFFILSHIPSTPSWRCFTCGTRRYIYSLTPTCELQQLFLYEEFSVFIKWEQEEDRKLNFACNPWKVIWKQN